MAILRNTSIISTGALVPPSGTQGQRTSDTVVPFTATGTTSWTVPAGITSVEVLVVGGGGAGGVSNASGGGAGGVVYRPFYPVTPGANLTVTVGAGNTNPNRFPTDSPSFKGGNSVFDGITALGGGNGGGDDSPGVPGGCGGGSADNPNMLGGVGLQPNSPSGGFGYPGGQTVSSNNDGGTGGGGAGQPGRNHGEIPSYDGGIGLLFDISGTPTWYAGGGGGFRRDITGFGVPEGSGSPAPTGSGRSGRGGTGGGGNGGDAGQPGANNTGGGGGGGGGSPGTGGNGGPGVVILRYNTELGGSSVGAMRYNTDMARFEVRQNGNWIPTYRRVQTFNSPGTFSVPTGINRVDVLVVAGGGGGGQDVGGGGGGGGVVEAFGLPVSPGTSIPVTVGGGGRGASRSGHPSSNGETGGSSSFGSLLTAQGGGGGGVWANQNSQSGGSGGGAGSTPGAWNSFGSPGTQQTVSNFGARQYGNTGGNSSAGNAPLYGRGAGGGGAATQGDPSGPGHTGGGHGGDGWASSISGELVWYGGGGGGTNDQGTFSTYPGKGGGGQGKRSTGGAESYMDGLANSGGGGAGGTNEGGNGGPGVVIVRF